MQLRKPDGTPASGWFVDEGMVTPSGQLNTQLSSSRIWRYLYFATALEDQTLYIAQKKNGIVTQLPAV